MHVPNERAKGEGARSRCTVDHVFTPLLSVCCLLAGGVQGQGFQVDSSCVSEACVTVIFYLSWFSVSQLTNSKIKTLAEEEMLMVNVFVVVGF